MSKIALSPQTTLFNVLLKLIWPTNDYKPLLNTSKTFCSIALICNLPMLVSLQFSLLSLRIVLHFANVTWSSTLNFCSFSSKLGMHSIYVSDLWSFSFILTVVCVAYFVCRSIFSKLVSCICRSYFVVPWWRRIYQYFVKYWFL